MSLQFIIGSSGAGKSYFAYERVIRESMEHPERNYYIIVPEQFTMQTQKNVVEMHSGKGILNIDVLSFERLAYRVFEEVGGAREVLLDDTGKSMVLQKLVQQHRKNLPYLGSQMNKPGYLDEVKSLLSEFMQYDIHEEDLEPVELSNQYLTVKDQEDDSFLKYYSKNQKRPKKRKLNAFQIRRKKKDGNHLHVHESVVSVQAVLKRSRELGVSMTIFLTALFMMAINEEMSKMQKKKPVVLMVPVNLRKFFPSSSMLNFFNWIEPGYNFTTQDQSFEAVLKYTKEFFETEENAMIFKTEQEMSVSDTNTFSEKEAGLTPTVIAMDGIAVVVNNDNPTDELSSDQVKSIFTGDVLTWDEALQ